MKLIILFVSTISSTIITLTDSSSGKINAKINDIINVNLAGSGGANPALVWSAPTTSDYKVVKQIFSSATFNGGAQGFFTVSTSGSSTLSATKACKPSPGKICSQLIQEWNVMVNIN